MEGNGQDGGTESTIIKATSSAQQAADRRELRCKAEKLDKVARAGRNKIRIKIYSKRRKREVKIIGAGAGKAEYVGRLIWGQNDWIALEERGREFGVVSCREECVSLIGLNSFNLFNSAPHRYLQQFTKSMTKLWLWSLSTRMSFKLFILPTTLTGSEHLLTQYLPFESAFVKVPA